MQQICVRSAIALALITGTLTACGGDSSSSNQTQTTGVNAPSESTDAGTENSGVPSVPFKSVEQSLPRELASPNCKGASIAWLSPTDASENLHIIGEALDRYASTLGAELTLEDARGNPDKQVSQFQESLVRNADGILVLPLDPQALQPLLQQARSANTPVVGVEVDLESTGRPAGYTSQIWLSRDKVAYLQARRMAETLGTGGTIGIIGSAIPVPSLKFATERAEFWAKKFGLRIAARADATTDDIAGGSAAMTQILSESPEVEGVIAYADEVAVGASSTARAAGDTSILLVGIGGTKLGREAVSDGRIDATVQVQSTSLAQLMVYDVCNAINGKDVPGTMVVPKEPDLINSKTLDETPSEEELLEEIR